MQNWTEEPFELSNEGETDLQNMENNFKTLKSMFSGASYGLNTEAGTPWYDSATPILGEGLLKIRKQGDDGWLGVLALGQESDNGLVWFHGDDLSNQEGWVIDTKITEDRVMALKNHGSGVYTTGRQVFGQWNITGIDTEASHKHTGPSHYHLCYNYISSTSWDTDGAGNPITTNPKGSGSARAHIVVIEGGGNEPDNALGDLYSNNAGTGLTGAGQAHTHTQDGSWKIRGQVGIVIYPDI